MLIYCKKLSGEKIYIRKKCECAIKNVNTKPKTNGQSFCYRLFCFYVFLFYIFFCFYIFFYIFFFFFTVKTGPKCYVCFDETHELIRATTTTTTQKVQEAKSNKLKETKTKRERQRKTPK